jgi:hypothetical protein
MTLEIEFAYSSVFGTYAWYFFVFFKVFQILYEYILENIFEDQLLFNPMSIILSTIYGVSTLGVANFFDFLFGTFVGLGILMCDRCYICLVNDYTKNLLEDKLG